MLPDDCLDSGISSREAQVGGLKLDLPLDEDDYLMPSAQQNQNNAGYMDLIGDSKLPGQFILSRCITVSLVPQVISFYSDFKNYSNKFIKVKFLQKY